MLIESGSVWGGLLERRPARHLFKCVCNLETFLGKQAHCEEGYLHAKAEEKEEQGRRRETPVATVASECLWYALIYEGKQSGSIPLLFSWDLSVLIARRANWYFLCTAVCTVLRLSASVTACCSRTRLSSTGKSDFIQICTIFLLQAVAFTMEMKSEGGQGDRVNNFR